MTIVFELSRLRVDNLGQILDAGPSWLVLGPFIQCDGFANLVSEAAVPGEPSVAVTAAPNSPAAPPSDVTTAPQLCEQIPRVSSHMPSQVSS